MATGGANMKLLVLSDLHLEFGQFRVPDVAFDVVILAGDIAVPASKVPFWACRATNFGESTPVVFVPGNHEFYNGVMSNTLMELRRALIHGHLTLAAAQPLDMGRFDAPFGHG